MAEGTTAGGSGANLAAPGGALAPPRPVARARFVPPRASAPVHSRVLRLARRSPLAVAGLLIVGLVAIVALAAPLLATSDPIEQDLTTVLKPPFWEAEGSVEH